MKGQAGPNRADASPKEPASPAIPQCILSLPDLATPQEVACVLRCTKRFVQAEIAAGRLEASRVAGRYLVTPDAVAAYIERQKVCPSRTEAPASITAKIAESGRSSGSSMADDAAKARALATAETLIRRSQTGCSDTNPSAPVIPLNAASPTY